MDEKEEEPLEVGASIDVSNEQGASCSFARN